MSGSNSYIATIATSDGSFYQPEKYVQNVGAERTYDMNGYRTTGYHVGEKGEIEEIQQSEAMRAAAAGRDRLEGWSWGITIWNVVAFLLCPACCYCLLGALLCNVFAYVDHKARDYDQKRQKLMCAIGWSIACFILGIIGVIIALIVLFVVFDAQSWNTVPTVPGNDFFM